MAMMNHWCSGKNNPKNDNGGDKKTLSTGILELIE
jgi:hypothetical protein